MKASMRRLSPYETIEVVAAIALSILLHLVRSHVISPTWERFSLRNILIWPTGVDAWERYGAVARHLSSLKSYLTNGRLLEVGAGGGGIADVFPGIDEKLDTELVVTDIIRGKLRKTGNSFVSDASQLPFRSSSFDGVICVDVLEHLHFEVRGRAIEELKRVSKRVLVIHVPCDSEDGEYRASVDDNWLKITLRRILEIEDPNIEEHIESGPVMIEDLLMQLPGSSVSATQKSEIWRKHNMLSKLPYARFLSGLVYYLLWRGRENGGTNHSAVIVWRKDLPRSGNPNGPMRTRDSPAPLLGSKKGEK